MLDPEPKFVLGSLKFSINRDKMDYMIHTDIKKNILERLTINIWSENKLFTT